jgi:hypothetical protein
MDADRVKRTSLKAGGKHRCSGDRSWMRKGHESAYDKCNISGVIYDIDVPKRLTMVATVKRSK